MPKLSELAPQVGTMRTIRKTFRKKPPWDKRDSQHNKQKSRQTSKFTLEESHTGKTKCKTEKLAHDKKCQTTTNSKNDNCRSLTISYQNPSTFLSFSAYLFSLRRSMKELGVSPVGIGVLGSSAYSGNGSAFCAFFVSILPGLRIPSFPTIGNS